MKKIILPFIIVLGVVAFFSIFIVKEVNQAIVLQFGDPKKIVLKPLISNSGKDTQLIELSDNQKKQLENAIKKQEKLKQSANS